MKYTIKAIETTYRGVKFRSRLEATWACFFDIYCGWDWEYEPFDLDGWLPDFRIKGVAADLLIEVKPIEEYDKDIWEKCAKSVLKSLDLPLPPPDAKYPYSYVWDSKEYEALIATVLVGNGPVYRRYGNVYLGWSGEDLLQFCDGGGSYKTLMPDFSLYTCPLTGVDWENSLKTFSSSEEAKNAWQQAKNTVRYAPRRHLS